MSGPSLFGEPDPANPAPPRGPCCDLDSPTAVAPRVWAMLHTLCHSRIPFTLATYTTVAACSETRARTAIEAAHHRGWLRPVWPEPYMTDPVEQWVGCLSTRREP